MKMVEGLGREMMHMGIPEDPENLEIDELIEYVFNNVSEDEFRKISEELLNIYYEGIRSYLGDEIPLLWALSWLPNIKALHKIDKLLSDKCDDEYMGVKICAHCGWGTIPIESKASYCSGSCRKAAFDAREVSRIKGGVCVDHMR